MRARRARTQAWQTRGLNGRLALLLAGILVVFGPAGARPLQDVLNAGTLRVGVALASPWAMRDSEGELIGFEIDVAKRLAADMDVEAEFVVYEWDRLVFAVEADEVDLVVAGLTITPELALHVNFSNPHSLGGVTLATNTGRTSAVGRLDELNDSQYRLGAVEGSVSVELAGRVLPRATLELFDDVESASEALVAGEIDAYLEHEPVPGFLALEHPARVDVPISRPLLESPTGFAVGKGHHELVLYLNSWIVARKADTWLPTTEQYWLESLKWRDRVGDAP